MRRLRDRVAVVTGAASGIGRDLVERFAAEGMRVVASDVERPALDALVARLRGQGADVTGRVADVADPDAVQALADATLEAYGAVHLVCNNAGVDSGAPFADIPQATWDWVMDVNYGGVLNGCRVFLPLLREQEEGHIVNTASVVALRGYLPTGAPYVASKFAILGLSEALAYELGKAGDTVGISVLCPGAVDTRMPDAERNRPADVPAMAEHPERRPVLDYMRRGGVTGMPPADVAGHVVDAILARRFYVLTHPEEALEAIDDRRRWMVDDVAPYASRDLVEG